MQGAEADTEVDSVDTDNLAIGKEESPKDIESAARSEGSLNVGTRTTPLAM